ncbi:hypothetical protein N7450_004011 [Penicillium hetheringtonii]|uniref:Uncharacterized protein n=1 Tax=Penicillium hetheringtonii TaxID=911720 RepID=A0AAD6GVZ1_9EURO|nr:hypothetical protein N7450_004011 [Penicillium hetheringtonii]
MPSTSTVSGYTFLNWGPVTTTFTAPSTCTGHSDQIQIGVNSTRPHLLYGLQCETIGGLDCIPSPTFKQSTTQDNHPSIYFQAAYYSPGLYCPADWKTVGIATRGEGSSISTSGIFVPTTTPTVLDRDRELFLDILDHGETAILCCPSAYTADMNVGCYSTVSDYEIPSSGCYYNLGNAISFSKVKTEINGTTRTLSLPTLVNSTASTTPRTSTFDSDDKSTMVGIARQAIITMIHKESDNSKGGASTSNAAVKYTGASTWQGFGSVIGISVAAMALGAAMILPW